MGRIILLHSIHVNLGGDTCTVSSFRRIIHPCPGKYEAQWPNFQIRSHGEGRRVRTSTYHFGECNSTYHSHCHRNVEFLRQNQHSSLDLISPSSFHAFTAKVLGRVFYGIGVHVCFPFSSLILQLNFYSPTSLTCQFHGHFTEFGSVHRIVVMVARLPV